MYYVEVEGNDSVGPIDTFEAALNIFAIEVNLNSQTANALLWKGVPHEAESTLYAAFKSTGINASLLTHVKD